MGFKKFINTYRQFIRSGIQEATIYRVDWFFRILGNLIIWFVTYYIWKAVFYSNNNNIINGFTLPEMMIYIFIVFLSTTLIYSEGIYSVGEEIRSGAIAMRLIKPVDYDITFLFHEIGKKTITTYLLVPFVVIIAELIRTQLTGYIQFNFKNFILYIISSVLAYFINFYLNISFGYIAFFSKNIWGANMIKNTIVGFLSGAIIPFTFFPDAIENILTLLPFASLNYIPAMIYLGFYEGKKLLLCFSFQLFWVFVFLFLSKLLWKVSVKHLCVQGG